jgi:hypothetical protein
MMSLFQNPIKQNQNRRTHFLAPGLCQQVKKNMRAPGLGFPLQFLANRLCGLLVKGRGARPKKSRSEFGVLLYRNGRSIQAAWASGNFAKQNRGQSLAPQGLGCEKAFFRTTL